MRKFHELSPSELGSLDIAEVHLSCAEGLVGSESLDVDECLSRIHEMADAVSIETQRMWNRFESSPGEFQNSPEYFRMLVLATVLQRDFGVTYNVEWFENPPDFTDSRNIFLHGILDGTGGTCSSLPVLYAAVSRRLGYPVKLVGAVSHLFCRWDAPPDGLRFNVEATTRGLVCHNDDHYKTWPKPMLPQDLRGDYYLRNFTPQEELACFYTARARCFFDWMKYQEAMQLMHLACELFPDEPNFRGFHAISTVAFRESEEIASYDLEAGIVLENRVERPIEAWERWAMKELESEQGRIRSIHQTKSTSPYSTDSLFADYHISTG